MNIFNRTKKVDTKESDMEVSKVTLNPELTSYKKLSSKEKLQLREQKIKDLIQSKPYSTYISRRELGEAIGMTGTSAATLVDDMIERGILSRHEVGLTRCFYTVNGPVKTKKLDNATPPPAEVTSEPVKEEKPLQVIEANGFGVSVLTQLAKDYYWETTSNDLRQFIDWIGKREVTSKEAGKL